MTTVKETLEKCASEENIAGSRRSLNFYKSVYKADDLENYGSLASLEDAWNGYANSLHPMLDLRVLATETTTTQSTLLSAVWKAALFPHQK